MIEEGYSILDRNYRNRYGEIDIIAKKGRNLIFTEVKTRTNLKYGDPLETVNKLKIARIKKVASLYLTYCKLSTYNPSFNVISIIIDRSFIKKIAEKGCTMQKVMQLKTIKDNKSLRIEHIYDAF